MKLFNLIDTISFLNKERENIKAATKLRFSINFYSFLREELEKEINKPAYWLNLLIASPEAKFNVENPQEWGISTVYSDDGFYSVIEKEDTAPSWGDNGIIIKEELISSFIFVHCTDVKEGRLYFDSTESNKILSYFREESGKIQKLFPQFAEEIKKIYAHAIKAWENAQNLLSQHDGAEEIHYGNFVTVKPSFHRAYRQVEVRPMYRANAFHKLLNMEFGEKSLPYDVN